MSQAQEIQDTWRAMRKAEADANEIGDPVTARLFRDAQRYGAGSREWREACDTLQDRKIATAPESPREWGDCACGQPHCPQCGE